MAQSGVGYSFKLKALDASKFTSKSTQALLVLQLGTVKTSGKHGFMKFGRSDVTEENLRN